MSGATRNSGRVPELLTKPIERVTAAEVEALVGWPETLTVEFKEALPGRDGRPDGWLSGREVENYAKEKLFKEVVAFANTAGGHLVLGIAETDAAPALAASVTPVPRCVDLAERLGRAAAQAIDPPIPLLLVRGVPTTSDGSGVVVVRVPASRLAPHRAPDRHCYIRRGTEAVPMGMREIQDMTLAAGRREEAVEARFERAARVFERSFAEPRPGGTKPEGVAFRITAVPVGARFDLGRLYGREGMVQRRERHRVKVDGREMDAVAVRLPNRMRPILRGVRWSSHDEDADCYLDAYGDGAVELGCRVGPHPRSGERFLVIGWVVAHAVNVLRTADALRTEAGAADCEYGVEVELRCADPSAVVRLVWGHGGMFDDGLGRGLRHLPLRLPRISFGSMAELDAAMSLVVNDLSDAAASHQEEPWSVEVLQPALGT